MKLRIVIDTNVYVSRLLKPHSTPGQAVAKAWAEAITLISSATFAELSMVLKRKKLAAYILPGSINPYLAKVHGMAEEVIGSFPIRACRDPRDDKFLEVAVHGRADLIVTGDHDLLDLHPFRGISIITPAAYIEMP